MAQIQQSDNNEDSCKILIGNKCDLSDSREVKIEEGEELARQYDIPFMETSAKDSLNVDNLFQAMATAMKEKAGATTAEGNGEGKITSLQQGKAVEEDSHCCRK